MNYSKDINRFSDKIKSTNEKRNIIRKQNGQTFRQFEKILKCEHRFEPDEFGKQRCIGCYILEEHLTEEYNKNEINLVLKDIDKYWRKSLNS